MKKMTQVVLAGLILSFQLSAQLHPDYENPEVFERNQVPAHATLMPFENIAQALEGDRTSSPFYHSLNGTWQFHWAQNPREAPVDFYKPEYMRADWSRIKVPANWQMEGFGYPLFRNIGLPHPVQPPEVPKDFNPVGSYYRTFELPPDWKEQAGFPSL